MNDVQLAELLRQRNPWWRDADGWAADDEKLRFASEAPFDYRPDPLDSLVPGGLYTLTGPRRVGKSLEIKRKIQALIESGVPARSVVFCSCDNFSTQDLRRLFRVARGVLQGDSAPLWWFVDEITAVTGDWSAVVKEVRDNTPVARDTVVLTGSSARGLDRATKDFAGRRGAGRQHDRILLPVGFRTYCELTGAGIAADLPAARPSELQSQRAKKAFDELAFWTEELHQSWINYLRVGGFPQAVRELRDSGDAETFAADLWDVIEGEALIAAGMTSAQMSGLLDALVDGLTNPFNASRIQREVGFTTNASVYDRLIALEQAYLIWLCHQDDGFRPKLGAFRKAYFLDPLLARALAHRNPAFSHPDQSKLVEQQVGLSLLRAIRIESGMNLDSSELLLYRRTKSKAEIDFVSQFLSAPVEVKYVDSGWARAAQTLRANFGCGIVATRRSNETESDVWAVPVANLAWLLDTSQMPPPQTELPGFGA